MDDLVKAEELTQLVEQLLQEGEVMVQGNSVGSTEGVIFYNGDSEGTTVDGLLDHFTSYFITKKSRSQDSDCTSMGRAVNTMIYGQVDDDTHYIRAVFPVDRGLTDQREGYAISYHICSDEGLFNKIVEYLRRSPESIIPFFRALSDDSRVTTFSFNDHIYIIPIEEARDLRSEESNIWDNICSENVGDLGDGNIDALFNELNRRNIERYEPYRVVILGRLQPL